MPGSARNSAPSSSAYPPMRVVAQHPPGLSLASYRSTDTPRNANAHAAASPAMPPPTDPRHQSAPSRHWPTKAMRESPSSESPNPIPPSTGALPRTTLAP